MQNRLSLLLLLFLLGFSQVFLFENSLASHPSTNDGEIRFYFNCGESLFTQMDEEGRGGLSALLGYVEREKMNLDLKNGKGYLLFPFISNKFKKEYPFDGLNFGKDKVLETGAVKLGIGGIQSFLEEKDLTDYDSYVIFVSENEEGGLTSLPRFKEGGLPIFILGEKKPQSSFVYLGNIHQIECPKDFGKLGVLSLYFRKRNLIRQSYDIVSINLQDRNRSWKPKSDKFPEENLPKPDVKKKDSGLEVGKSNIPYDEPHSFYDREILGTAKGFGTTP